MYLLIEQYNIIVKLNTGFAATICDSALDWKQLLEIAGLSFIFSALNPLQGW
ncbi:MAG TPA: hypothetical protein VIM41_12720 [Gammaproteobacteria bacterium]